MKLAVILPSRGLSFSRTCDELLRELKGLDYRIFFSIGRTLPDCFNIPLNEALEDKSFTHVLIVEDDMIIPKGILRQMLDKKYPAVALDYPFKEEGDATVMFDPSGMALWTGTGFILIERWLLDMMPKPVFVTDKSWEIMITPEDELLFFPRDVSKMKTYGLHDINFGLALWSNDIPILVMKRTAGQRKLRKKGATYTNAGADEIYEIKTIVKNNITKSKDTKNLKMYQSRLNQIKSVRLLDKKPDNVVYINGQARLRSGKDVVI